MASFSVSCSFLFPNFAPTWWKKLGFQAATSSSKETLFAILKEKLRWKLSLQKLLLAIENWRKCLSKKCLSKNLNCNFQFFIQDFLSREFSSVKLNTSYWLDSINLSSLLLDFVQNCLKQNLKT
jgi:hypothetical protein